jgi:hypothetical protein
MQSLLTSLNSCFGGVVSDASGTEWLPTARDTASRIGVRLFDGEEWQSYTRDFKRSAFRMEVHPVYTMPVEADDARARWVV